MVALYNEIDLAAAAVILQLIDDGIIAPGIVNTQSIKDLTANDLRGFTQCHLFAGGGLWSVAARLAGWPDDKPIWTASCPCQPFSQAGKGGGTDDPRHLWPDVDRLVREAHVAGFGPHIIVGEQVSGSAGADWFDGVAADLARQGYEVGARDVPACAVDAPNIRQRLYWVAVADTEHARPQGQLHGLGSIQQAGGSRPADQFERRDELDGNMADTSTRRADGHGQIGQQDGKPSRGRRPWNGDGASFALGDTEQSRLQGHAGHDDGTTGRAIEDRSVTPTDGGDLGDTNGTREFQRSERSEGVQSECGGRDMHSDGRNTGVMDNSISDRQRQQGQQIRTGWHATHLSNARPNGTFWSDHEWIICHDGKTRRAQSGLRHVVNGISDGVDYFSGQSDVPEETREALKAVLSPALLVQSFKGRTPLWKITGNAINPVLAAEVLGALLEAEVMKPFAARAA